MTVAELIDELKRFDQDAEVRLAQQPNYPMDYSVGDVVEVELDDEEEDNVKILTVFIGEGKHVGYLDRAVSVELGWRD